MRKIMQFRYYGEGDPRNFPTGLNANALTGETAFTGYFPITQIGIQAPPGTTFYLNDVKQKDTSIIIGNSGLYELNLDGIGEINGLIFATKSLSSIGTTYGGHLIVDIVYEKGE